MVQNDKKKPFPDIEKGLEKLVVLFTTYIINFLILPRISLGMGIDMPIDMNMCIF